MGRGNEGEPDFNLESRRDLIPEEAAEQRAYYLATHGSLVVKAFSPCLQKSTIQRQTWAASTFTSNALPQQQKHVSNRLYIFFSSIL